VLLASGLVAGEALMGIALAAAVGRKLFPLTTNDNLALTVIVFAVLLAAFVPVTRSSR
jgi:hypothetical protein